jgi:hypothetical protein
MCPPLSCCTSSSAASLRTVFVYLVRLLVARNAHELLPDQLAAANSRLPFLWEQTHLLLRGRFRMNETEAVALAQRLTGEVLQRECCRRAVWRTVPLSEALGPFASYA